MAAPMREEPDVEAAAAPAPAEPETTKDKCRLKLWAGASVLGIIASTALLIVDTIYIKLPYAAAAVFLAPVGARLAHALAEARLRRAFAIGLVVVARNMIREAVFAA